MSLEAGRIHIAFQGKETDRISEPIIKYKADKAYIFIFKDEKTEKFMEQHNIIKQKLKNNNIDAVTVNSEIHSYNDVIQNISKIIKQEREKNPACEIFINISVGTKITAVAAMDACRLWRCSPYYVLPLEYLPENQDDDLSLSKGIKDIIYPPHFEMVKPETHLIEALKIIATSKKGFMYKKDFKKKLQEKKLLHILKKYDDPKDPNKKSAEYMALNQQFIIPLMQKWKYIEQSDDKRNKKLTLTDLGREALQIFKYLD
ncbi:MAG: HFX_2341 family transcriptional regulator domain-containing protein [Candidatus Helarchaeota archaeon]